MSTQATDATQLTGALDRLFARLDRLEAKVDALAHASNGAADLHTDTLPTEMVDLSAPRPALRASLAAKLEEPDVAERLVRLLDRLDAVEAAVDAYGTFAQRLPTIIDAAGSVAQRAWDTAEAQGIHPPEAGQRALGLAQKAATPNNLAIAERLLDQAPVLERLLAHTGTLSEVLDALERVDPKEVTTVVDAGADALPKLARFLDSPAFRDLLGVFDDERAVQVAGTASTALVEVRKEAVEPVGPFKALLRLGDPDVRRAVGFALALAKQFGSRLS